jgi:hypothetical protein
MVPCVLGIGPYWDRPSWSELSSTAGCQKTDATRRSSHDYVSRRSQALLTAPILLLFAVSCGGSLDICNCSPRTPVSQQYRSTAKHVPLPQTPPQEITVSAMLQWPQNPTPDFHAPRQGRELQVFHIRKAFLQNLGLDSGDCDLHFSISDTADKNAPRAIVETPVDPEYCPARLAIQSQLAQRGVRLDAEHGGELATPLPVEVRGLAFHDFNHDRPAPFATTWELHPAIVTLLP